MNPILKAFIFILATFGITMVISMVVAAIVQGIAKMVQRKGKTASANSK